MKKNLLLIALSGVIGLSGAAQTFSGGDGSADNPYLIATEADLAELATVIGDGNNLSGKLLTLEKDITITGESPMIGYTGDLKPFHFAGTFDGKGHSISNLTLKTEKQYGGFFAYVDAEGTVKNLTLVNSKLSTGNSYGGILVAANDGLVDNCHVVNGIMESTNGSYKGGVVGQNKGLVSGCSYSGTITSSSNAGGIIGQNYSRIENCNSSATIVSSGPNQSNVQFGGITGITIKLSSGDPYIHDCYFTGNIEGATANNCGGITGTLSGGEMLRCWNAGYISSSGSCGALVNSLEKASTIKDCYNVGTVYDTFSAYVGGLIGTVSTDKSALVLENCLNMGTMFTAVTALHEGMELAGSNVGGLTVTNSFFDAQTSAVYSTTGGLTTDQLTSGEVLSGFDPEVWTFTAGLYPRLANSATTDVAILGATPIFLAQGQTSSRVTSNFTVSTANDVEWEIKSNTAAKLNGNTVTVTRGSKKVDVVLTAYLGDISKRTLVTVYPMIFEGQGTEQDPYIIASAADLMKLSDATNAQELSFTGEYFKMTADIDMAGTDFVPMAFNGSQLAFNGVFDGNGHSIKNLSLDSRTNQVLNTGLFRTVFTSGVIKNLTIDKSCKFDIYRNFAPFVSTLYGTIENCRNYADITTTNGFSGGIAYLAYGTDAKIINCYNEGNLISTEKDGYMGGIVYTNEGLVENCQNNGNVTAAAASSNTVGGIAGSSKGIIRNVINAGNLSASATVGGIVADSKSGGTITNALSLGQLEAFTSRDALGAIVGKDAGATFSNVYYDTQIVMYANSYDGITGLPTASLTAADFSMNDENWSKATDRYPMLVTFADEAMSELASMPVWFADGQRSDQLTADGTLASAQGLVWSVSESPSFTIEGNRLVVTNTDTFNTATLTSTYRESSRSISVSALANLFTGTGTEEDPYLIESIDDLKKLSDDIAASNLEYGGKYFKVTKDLDATGVEMQPIATMSDFKGIFDGNGKTIDNLKIETTIDGTGLFGRVGDGGVIKNLTIGANSSFSGKSSVGAFAGMLINATIDNCVNNATVAATAATANLGGLVGQATGASVISNCVNNADIEGGKSQTGGVIGYANGAEITITNVSNTGDITGTTKTGGIAGNIISTTINGASNSGAITGTTDVAGIVGYTSKVCAVSGAKNFGTVDGGTEVGGIVGYASADFTLTDSYNVGDITATASTAGGLMARGTTPEIKSSFNAGNVTNTKTSLGSTIPGAAGILGKGDPIITDVYNVGTVTAEKNLGGFVGSYNLTSKTATLTRVYQAGKIVSTIEAPAGMAVFVGREGKVALTDAYYDSQVVYNLTDENATGVTTAELAKTNLGEDWVMTENALPVVKAFAEDDYARLYSAPVFLAATENVGKVSAPFTVSNAYGVTWTGDAAAFSIDGDTVTPISTVAGDFNLTATLGSISRTVTLTLTGDYSGIGAVGTDNSDAEAVYFTLQGVKVVNPVEGQVYIVVRGEKATKELYRK